MLCTVISIYPHILRRKIAGEKLQRSAAGAQHNADFIDGFGHVGMRPSLVEWASCAVTANLLFAQVDVDSLRIDFHSGVADGRQDTSPVGIGPGPGGLYQRRIGYRAPN